MEISSNILEMPLPRSATSTAKSVMPKSEMSLRERKNLRARQTILEEATRLFLSHGYSNTTLKDIADAAETSIATIMRYFASKDAILLHRERIVVSRLAERVRAHAYKTLSEGIRDVIWMSLVDFDERTPLFNVMWNDLACVPLQAAMRRDWEKLIEDLFIQFSPLTPEGRLRAKSLAYMLVASGAAGMQFWQEESREIDLQDLQPKLIDEFIAAFVVPLEVSYAARIAA